MHCGAIWPSSALSPPGERQCSRTHASRGNGRRIPECACSALSVLVDQVSDTECKIARYDKVILATARDSEICRRLMKVTKIGPFTATALAAAVGDPKQFSSARHFAAWLGLMPKQHSAGGRERLGGISKRGDGYIRKLLIHGARAAVHRRFRNSALGFGVSVRSRGLWEFRQ